MHHYVQRKSRGSEPSEDTEAPKEEPAVAPSGKVVLHLSSAEASEQRVLSFTASRAVIKVALDGPTRWPKEATSASLRLPRSLSFLSFSLPIKRLSSHELERSFLDEGRIEVASC